ncbi:CBS domain-containing protein [Ramlibacter sp. H39-3-26]|uniref:CBS domain-containing protein n=1 Tax=Curvibacter soli TaxID=3031331 RepID=UPI0023DB8727|nr:CBS domain-containing protein [Ramlibacter sp. H39-3-26]MDF1484642.1 CBS domain-containing protein [Ramlibacter sp. H39-3-26]
MFFVYGPAGQMYRGGMEDLPRVARVRRSPRVQALGPVAVEPPAADAPGSVLKQVVHEALNAYQQASQGPAERQPLTRVADVMTLDVVSVNEDATAAEAWQLLAAQRVSQAPVLDARRRLVGLLTRADLMPAELLPAPGAQAAADAATLAARRVSALMLSPVPAVAADTDLRHVARVLLDLQLPGLPVTDDHGSLAGFIARADILRAVVADPPLDLWG